MESNSTERQRNEDGVMEVPEIDGGDLLVELLDASLAAEEDFAGQALGFAADDVDGDGDFWIDGQELDCGVYAHQDCEDCGLDGILSDFEEYGSPRPRPSPAPYAFFVDEYTLDWAGTADAGMGPFAGGCMGDWYMDGMVMAMEWDEEEEGAFPFEPCCGGGEAGADQVYGSPLWE